MSKNAKETLVTCGLTEQQASAVVAEFANASELAYLTPEAVRAACEDHGAKRPRAGAVAKAVAEFATPPTAAPPAPSEITVTIDKGEKEVAAISSAKSLLRIVADKAAPEERREEAAAKLGRRVVVNRGTGDVDAEATFALWDLPSGDRLPAWGPEQHPIVAAIQIFQADEMIELDPLDGAVLTDGFNNKPASLANWKGVSMERRALAAWAVRTDSNVRSLDPIAVADALREEALEGRWKMLDARADADEIAEVARTLRVRRSKLRTVTLETSVERVPAMAPNRPTTRGGARKRLYKVLTGALTVQEMRMFIDDYDRRLPPSIAWTNGATEVAFNIVDTLERRGGLKGDRFWDHLRSNVPHQIAEVDAIRSVFR